MELAGKNNDSFFESVIDVEKWRNRNFKDPNQDFLAFIIIQVVTFDTLLSDLFYCFHRR